MSTRELYATLRPLRSRRIAHGIIVLEAVAFAVLLIALGDALGWIDRALFVLLAATLAWFLHRLASVRAQPSESGLHVRNLFLSRDLRWAQIVSVRFGGGNPWVLLDLDDGETLPVMGIQRSDGARAVAESRRLATLVELHSRTDRND